MHVIAKQSDNDHEWLALLLWCGVAGLADDSTNFELYDVTTIANYDRSIVSLLLGAGRMR